jgi:hypothetical protein
MEVRPLPSQASEPITHPNRGNVGVASRSGPTDAARHNGGEQRDGVDVGMLAVAAVAAVAAAMVTSKLWPGGTLISTAMTPVIVALVKEWLRKPAQRISAVSAKAPQAAARVVAPARSAPSRRAAAWPEAQTERVGEAPPPSVSTPEGEKVVVPPAGSPAAGTPPAETFVEPAPDAPTRFRLYRRRSPHWRVAVVTGVLAFVVAALVITLPELVFGGAVGGNGSTTVFGGGSQPTSQTRNGANQKSGGGRTGDRRTTSKQQQQQQKKSNPKPTSKSTQPTAKSPSSPGSTQQPPSTAGAQPQNAPPTPSPSPSGQGTSGSGSGSSPPAGQ